VWFDYSNPDAPNIIAVGVTENDYTADAIGVETTLTSPSGRTVRASADGSVTAGVEVALPWDWNDLGDYFVETRHQPLCWGNWDGSLIYETHIGGTMIWHFNPDYFRCLAARETFVTTTFGASQVVLENTGTRDSSGRCIYTIIPDCNVACVGRGRAEDSVCSRYAVYIEPWHRSSLGYVCLGFFGLDKVVHSNFFQPCTQDR
jgi:hypothetical protein